MSLIGWMEPFITIFLNGATRVDSATQEMLESMLRFFALTNGRKLSFLPAAEPLVGYVLNECGDRTENALLYYCNAAFELTDRVVDASSEEFQALVLDIHAVLAVMIEQESAYPYIWYLDKSACPVSGPADRLWNILGRLALEALAAKGWSPGFPGVPFLETGRTGKRQRPRQ
jgi:hypothetical protein